MTTRVVRSLGVIGVVAALSITGVACGKSKDKGGGSGGAQTIAFMGAQTGPDAQLGINISNGAQLAYDQWTGDHSKVKFTKYDTQGDPTQASSQAKKVVSDKDIAVIGPAFSGESKTAVPILEKAKIPNVSPSATAVSLSANGWKYWHRVLSNDDVQGPGDADFMSKTLGAKTVAVIDDQSEYGKGLGDAARKQLKSSGVKVGPDGTLDPKGTDYSTTVNSIKAASPDVVFFAGYYSAAAKLLKQVRAAGVTAKFVSGDGSQDPKLAEQAGAPANGTLLSCTCSLAVGSSDPAAQKFEKDYTAKYKQPPSTYSSEGFDTMNLLLKGFDAGNTTSAKINDYLKGIDYKGVSKQIKFTDKGELAGDLLFFTEVVKGKLKFLGDAKSAKPVATS